jgi:hypothetical protein
MQLFFSYSKLFLPTEKSKFRLAILVPSNSDSAPNKIAYWIANELSNHNVYVVLYWLDNHEDGFYNPDKIFRKFSINDYDIVHSHLLRPDLSLAINIYRHKLFSYFTFKKNIKFVSTLHSDIYEDLKSDNGILLTLLTYLIWISALKSFDFIVVLTEVMKSKYIKNFPGKVKVIHNGIPFFSTFVPRKNPSLKANSIINIGYIGSLRKIKGIHCLLNLFSELPNIYNLNIAGSGPEYLFLKQFVANNNLADRVKFYGHINDINGFILLNDLFVFPSRSEGFCIAALDVLLSGKPIILSKISTFEELYDDPCFLKFELNNFSELNDSIKYLLQDYQGFLDRQIRYVNDKYTASVMGNNYLSFYCRILNINYL